jgi:hypothetical protein
MSVPMPAPLSSPLSSPLPAPSSSGLIRPARRGLTRCRSRHRPRCPCRICSRPVFPDAHGAVSSSRDAAPMAARGRGWRKGGRAGRVAKPSPDLRPPCRRPWHCQTRHHGMRKAGKGPGRGLGGRPGRRPPS